MKDLIFYNNGHPVRKEDFMYLKNRSDKTLMAICKAAWPDENTILLDVQVSFKSTTIYHGEYHISAGTIYYNHQLYSVKDTQTESFNLTYDGLCFMFPKDNVYDEEDSVRYEDEIHYPVHVSRVAVASYIDQTGDPVGWNDTIYKDYVLYSDIKSLGGPESVSDHIDNTNNPHHVNKSQVGLDNIPNETSNDIDSNSPEILATTALTSSLNDNIDNINSNLDDNYYTKENILLAGGMILFYTRKTGPMEPFWSYPLNERIKPLDPSPYVRNGYGFDITKKDDNGTYAITGNTIHPDHNYELSVFFEYGDGSHIRNYTYVIERDEATESDWWWITLHVYNERHEHTNDWNGSITLRRMPPGPF